jgi:hypothetical protein
MTLVVVVVSSLTLRDAVCPSALRALLLHICSALGRSETITASLLSGQRLCSCVTVGADRREIGSPWFGCQRPGVLLRCRGALLLIVTICPAEQTV